MRVIEAVGDYSRDYFLAYAPLLYRPLGAIENAAGAGEVLPRQPIAKAFICLFLQWMGPSVESGLEHAHLSMTFGHGGGPAVARQDEWFWVPTFFAAPIA